MTGIAPVGGGAAVRAWRFAWAWTPEGLVRGATVAVDEQGFLRDPAGLPVEDRPGILLPGLVNAHTHLELGPVAAAPGLGFLRWLGQLRAGPPPSAAQASRGVYAAIQAGTAAIGEITNNGWSTPAITAARLPARVFLEVFGIDVVEPPVVPGRLTPHAPHSTHPNVIGAAAAAPGPWSIHFDEDPAEALWLKSGQGPWRAAMARAGRRFDAFPIPGLSPAAYLASLRVAGQPVLDRRALLVHATCTRGADLDAIAAARVCLCVRSNLHITGTVPDVPGMLSRGIPLAIGTDSLASSPDLDLLAEASALRHLFPDVAPEVWVRALTEGGADALDLPMGRLRVGESPGLLWVDLPDSDDPLGALLNGTRWRRRWVACPG